MYYCIRKKLRITTPAYYQSSRVAVSTEQIHFCNICFGARKIRIHGETSIEVNIYVHGSGHVTYDYTSKKIKDEGVMSDEAMAIHMWGVIVRWGRLSRLVKK